MQDHYDFYLSRKYPPQNSDIQIINIGFSHNQPGYSTRYVPRDYYILHYIIDGCGSYIINGKIYNLNECDGFIVPPHTTVIYSADKKNPWTLYWVGFLGEKTVHYLSQINVQLSAPVFHFDQKAILIDCMEKMYMEVQSKDISFMLLLGYFYQLMGYIEKGHIKSNDTYDPAYYFKSAVYFIENNLYASLKVQDLADYINLSPSHAYRIIKKECGLTPHELIENMKISKACELLDKTNISIREISTLLGYEYESHFFHVFKKVMRTTPNEYRSRQK